MKFGIFCRILSLATFGRERVNGKVVQIYLQPDWQVDDAFFLQANHGMCSNPCTQGRAQNKDFSTPLRTHLQPEVYFWVWCRLAVQ